MLAVATNLGGAAFCHYRRLCEEEPSDLTELKQALCKIFQQPGRRNQLRRELLQLRQGTSESVADYYSKFVKISMSIPDTTEEELMMLRLPERPAARTATEAVGGDQ